MRKLIVVALAFVLTLAVATPTYGASGPRLAQAGSESLTAEEAGRLAGNYLGFHLLWWGLAADAEWDDGGSERSDITALTGPFETALVDVLADYFGGHVQRPPAISGTAVDAAAVKAEAAARMVLSFRPRTDRNGYRNSIFAELDKPYPNLRYTNWSTFYITFFRTATEEWAKGGSFVAQVERLRDLYTAISEAWPASTARSALDNIFNGTDSAPGLDNDIKSNIDGVDLTAPQAGLLVGQYINFQSYWKELIDTRGWKNFAWSDKAKVDTASARVEKHLENVVTNYFRKNLQESGSASKARSGAQKALAITDPDGADVRGNIYTDLGYPWGQGGNRYRAWDSFYNSLSDAVRDDIPKAISVSSQRMGRLLGLYTKLYNATPSQDRSGLDTMFNALTADIGAYMNLNHRHMVGPLYSSFKGDPQLIGCIDCRPSVSLIAARLYLFVRGGSLKQLQDAFGISPSITFGEWYAFYDAFQEAAG